MPDYILALGLGFLLDMLAGDPEWFPHPVRWMGKYITRMETRLRAKGGNLRAAAVALAASTVLLSTASTALVLFLLSLWGRLPLLIGMALINWTGLSMRCLMKEASGVRKALRQGVPQGRRQVARIVGRDTDTLDEHEIIAATIETVAENTVDGVVSPMVYSLLGGPVLMMGFKAVSTLDSMVGYMSPEYRDIGWFSARLDDGMNFIPARLTALLACAAAFVTGLDAKAAWRMVRRDHKNHTSPNCAWSEAAAAGALHIRLGGTHLYFGKPVVKPTIGDADRLPAAEDIFKTNRMMLTASLLMLALIMLPWILFL